MGSLQRGEKLKKRKKPDCCEKFISTSDLNFLSALVFLFFSLPLAACKAGLWRGEIDLLLRRKFPLIDGGQPRPTSANWAQLSCQYRCLFVCLRLMERHGFFLTIRTPSPSLSLLPAPQHQPFRGHSAEADVKYLGLREDARSYDRGWSLEPLASRKATTGEFQV